MHARCLLLGALVLTNFATVFAGDRTDGEAPLRLRLLLGDGSCIIGACSTTSVKVATSFAEMDLPFQKISRIALDTGTTARVVLRNGDTLTGELKVRTFGIDSIIGPISVDIGLVRSIECLTAIGLPGGLVEGLILHYSFEDTDNDKVTDRSGGGRDATVYGAKTVRDESKGSVCQFNGAGDYVGISSEFNSGEGPFSVSAWAKADDFRNDWCHIVGSMRDTVDAVWGIEKLDGQNRVAFWIGEDNRYVHADSAEVSPGMWYHFVGVCDSGEARLYVNGKRAGATRATPPKMSGDRIVSAIGRHAIYSESKRWWRGRIDDVMVFSKAISDEDVQRLFDAQKPETMRAPASDNR